MISFYSRKNPEFELNSALKVAYNSLCLFFFSKAVSGGNVLTIDNIKRELTPEMGFPFMYI